MYQVGQEGRVCKNSSFTMESGAVLLCHSMEKRMITMQRKVHGSTMDFIFFFAKSLKRSFGLTRNRYPDIKKRSGAEKQ